MYLNSVIVCEMTLLSKHLVSSICSLFYEVYDNHSGKVYALLDMEILIVQYDQYLCENSKNLCS